MNTEVILKRPLFLGMEVSQKSKSGFFSATDLVLAGNMWRSGKGIRPFDMTQWFSNAGTKEFIKALEESTGGKVKISGNGRGHHTWVHPFLFIDMALAISPQLKIETYHWIYDELVKYRNDSGDSYKKMAGALYLNERRKDKFKDTITDTARIIKEKCEVESWETASAEQLELRNNMHKNISLLADVLRNNADAIRIGIYKAIEDTK